MRVWHVTPEYINQHWTPEIIHLMFEKYSDWVEQCAQPSEEKPRARHHISDMELFAKMGITMQPEGRT
jgi:hypothetical protein